MQNTFIYKSEEEFTYFRQAGRLAARALDEACKKAEPGVSTLDLDLFAEAWIRDHQDAEPTFKGYLGFPASLCTSVNQEIVHGIPSKHKILREGDILSIDVGVSLHKKIEGKVYKFVGDNAKTVPIGKISSKASKLIEDTKQALEEGVQQCRPGNQISNIVKAIEDVARRGNYGLVKEFGGHGIGPEYHSAPFIPNYLEYFEHYPDCRIEKGMILAVEPMLNLGLGDIRKLKDNWTIVTKDNKLSAHYEYSVLVTEEQPEILTVLD